jgi:hypothetical protein
MPLTRAMAEDYQLEEPELGKTVITYRVAMDPHLTISMGGPLSKMYFESMFERAQEVEALRRALNRVQRLASVGKPGTFQCVPGTPRILGRYFSVIPESQHFSFLQGTGKPISSPLVGIQIDVREELSSQELGGASIGRRCRAGISRRSCRVSKRFDTFVQ